MRVVIRDTGDLRRVNKQLREHADGKPLRRELNRGMHAVLQPYVGVVQAAYLAAPSRSRKTRSRARFGDLRMLLARSVRVEVRTTGKYAGARIRADGRRMPSGMRALPRAWEGPSEFGWSGRWRHPVFPNAGPRHRFTDRAGTFVTEAQWVQQDSHPTFYRILRPSEGVAGAKVDKVLDDIKRKLEAR